jgi:fido (protein-threonine AMPylation protein)
MPPRAGYFVLAYSWDHHCDTLVASLRLRFDQIETRLEQLAREKTRSRVGLRNYYEEWERNKALYDLTLHEISSREIVIDSLGYRGYGVNRDLREALVSLRNEYADRIYKSLFRQFHRKLPSLKRFISFPEEYAASLSSEHLLSELCKAPGEDPLAHREQQGTASGPVLEPYWRVMSRETSWVANMAIFQKLFLNMGTSSATIMTGRTGLTNGRPADEVKQLVNRNLTNVCHDIFANLHTLTGINLDLFKWLHKELADGIDADPGNFRTTDFPDRNGVTFEFANFEREIADFAIVLKETEQHFPDLDTFLYDLARSYYMFIAIHPFWDSNGRVGRSFLNCMLLRKGLPPISFSDDEEVLYLPRYGGTMEDMHEYLKRRLSKAMETYFRERQSLQSLGFLDKSMHNASFDSGFFFRQIENGRSCLQVKFDAFVAADGPVIERLRDECRVVLPDENALLTMAVYCGFGSSPGAWEHSFRLAFKRGKGPTIEETDSDFPGVRSFEVGFTLELEERTNGLEHFSCIVLSDKSGLLFNNRGFNYRYRLTR